MDDSISRKGAINAVSKAWVRNMPMDLDIEGAFILTALREVPSTQWWTPCDEKLPEVGTSYLITRHGRVEIAYYEGKDLWRGLQGLTAFKTDSVTAWCELPEPYKAEGEDKE